MTTWRAMQVLAPVVRDRWELTRVFAEHLLTDTALPERPLARVFSVLLAVDVLDVLDGRLATAPPRAADAALAASNASGTDPAAPPPFASDSHPAADAGDASGGRGAVSWGWGGFGGVRA